MFINKIYRVSNLDITIKSQTIKNILYSFVEEYIALVLKLVKVCWLFGFIWLNQTEGRRIKVALLRLNNKLDNFKIS